jgi:signal transduction histidine kinase
LKAFASLRARLVVALLAVFALGAAATLLLISSHARSLGEVLEDSSLETQARDLIAGLRFDPDGRLLSVRPSAVWAQAYASGKAAYAVYGADGRLEARSPGARPPPARLAPKGGQEITPLRLIGPGQDLALGAGAPFGGSVSVTRINPGMPNSDAPDPWDTIAPLSLVAVLAAAAMLVAWSVAGWSLTPLKRTVEEAAAIGPERPEARLSGAGLTSEFQPLAGAVNRALDRVAAAYEAERRFTADAAHALRTPLSVLDLRLQRAQADGRVDWPVVRADLAELARVVAGLLALSRADRAVAGEPHTRLNLARLVREVAASMTPALEAEGRTLDVSAPAVLELRADARELRDLLYALLDNARAHGRGEVAVTLQEADGRAMLVVADAGEGVAEDARERMFERFQQVDAGRGGAGLGLAIVRQAARNHGGDAHFIGAARVEVQLSLS